MSAPASTEYGKSTDLAATVLPAAAPGTVQFKLNGVNFGTPVTVSGGSATLAWIPDVLGTDIAVTASFASGSANYLMTSTQQRPGGCDGRRSDHHHLGRGCSDCRGLHQPQRDVGAERCAWHRQVLRGWQ
ncbi:MAG: Ig-like domain repeat protein [Dehalococcoidia bacterium]|nr:Ig-like domain repeat protein [Dehalococcoidia bacterium]